MSDETFPVKLIRGGSVNTVLDLNAERIDVKYNRDVFEYKRQEVRRVNDRGFIATVFVVTGWYKGSSTADAKAFRQSFRDLMKTWYRAQDTHYFVDGCGDGTSVDPVGGEDCWMVAIKSGDATIISDEPDNVSWVITLMEAEG